MPKYTIELWELMESGFDIGLDSYSIFDESYRPILNKAIIDYYYTREISHPVPAVWRKKLNDKLDRIMRDKYNKLYESKAIEFNPLYNIDITEEFTHQVSSTSNTNSSTSSGGNTTSTANGGHSNSQSALATSAQYPNQAMAEGSIEDTVNIDNASKSKGSDSGTTNQTQTDTTSSHGTQDIGVTGGGNESYTKTTKGSSAGLPFSKAMLQLKEFLDQFDLDTQVCKELAEFFVSVYEI